MTKILLSYRRSDSAAIAGRIFDRLVSRYGSDSVFMDVDNIPFGTDFREHIKETLIASDVLLAIVGPQWLGVRGDGQNRIKQDTDPVRIEIETALQARVPIVPVLVDGTEMPEPTALPDTLEKFCYLNAASVESGRDFHHQVDRLIRSVDAILSAKAPPGPTPQQPLGESSSEAAKIKTPDAAVARTSMRTWAMASAAAALVVTAAGLFAFFYPQREPPRTTPPPERPPPVVAAPTSIGIAGPMTGALAAFGLQLKQGAEQASNDIGRAGGILGGPLSAVMGDDNGDPRRGARLASEFAAGGVKFVVGHFNSGVTIAASEVYQENGILQITPASTNPRVTERGLWNIFRTCGRDDQQGKVAGEYIAKHFRAKKVAVVHDKTVYGQGLADETRRTMNAKGVREVLYEGVNVGDKDFAALIAKIRAAGADLVYWGGLHTEGGLIVRQMRIVGIKATMMAGDGITTDEFATIGGPGVEGTLMTFAPDQRKRPEARAVVARFRAKNFEPEGYTLYSYAAVQLIKQAAEAANSLDPKKVAETLKSGRTFPTVIGDLSYDKKGDITRLDYVMYVWKKDASGKITYVEIDQ